MTVQSIMYGMGAAAVVGLSFVCLYKWMDDMVENTQSGGTTPLCDTRQSGFITWRYLHDYAQCLTSKHFALKNIQDSDNDQGYSAEDAAAHIHEVVSHFSCAKCVPKALQDIGPNGRFSLAQPNVIFPNPACIVVFLWAWRQVIAESISQPVVSWKRYCAAHKWSPTHYGYDVTATTSVFAKNWSSFSKYFSAK